MTTVSNWMGNLTIIRPLLLRSKVKLQRYCRSFGLKYIEDETNKDHSYTRNQIR